MKRIFSHVVGGPQKGKRLHSQLVSIQYCILIIV